MLSVLDTVKRRMSYARVIALGFLLIIFGGAVLLWLPISSKSGGFTGFSDAFFTSVSATCVTGLAVRDTAGYWSIFGKCVILVLIQTGGIGFMSLFTLTAMLMGKTIHLRQRKLLMQSAGGLQLGGIVALLKKIIIGTLIFEGSGAVLLCFRFCPQMGFWKGLCSAVFHSVSAFCNAGFDIMPGEYTSMTAYVHDPLVNLVLMGLILVGGLGFAVWSDIKKCGLRFSRYRLHTKIVLVSTAVLSAGGTALFYIAERDGLLAGMSFWEALLAAAFGAVSPRTAGFSALDLSRLSGAGVLTVVMLMFIGGNPGSTAGGIKTTTLWVLIMTAAASARRSKNVEIFKRRISEDTARRASAVITLYLSAVIFASFVICVAEGLGFGEVLFETVSAAATVGLSMGITAKLGLLSKIILMVLMYGGRVGGLTLGMVLAEKKVNVPLESPKEEILIG